MTLFGSDLKERTSVMRISKSEITTQDHYDKKQFKAVLNTTSSKGVLPKYTDEKIWVKTDVFGYESLAEVLASRTDGNIKRRIWIA